MDFSDKGRYGVAFYDRCWYWATVKQLGLAASKERALKTFAREATRLVDLVDDVDVARAVEPVRVARLMGMEPVSCQWSMLMVLDHLDRFNRDMMRLVVALTGDQPLQGAMAEEDYDPDPDVDFSILDQFESNAREYLKLVQSRGHLKTRRVFRHSWLGLMNAHQWNAWAAAHLRVHRRHVMKIMSVAGVL